MLPLFAPYIEPGEISKLATFNFYAKLSAVKAQEPLSGETVLLADEGSRYIAESAIELSRKNYAMTIGKEQKEVPLNLDAEENTDDFDLDEALPDEV